jgi:uncharacterized 2Fe-2S/4Fe-4S cluster protein (DUF4445 family)
MSEENFEIKFHPSGITVSANRGETLAEIALRSGVAIRRSCWGSGVCGKCRVAAIDGEKFLEPVTSTEERLLTAEAVRSGIRLSCCAKITASGAAEVLDIPENSGQKILDGVAGGPITRWTAARRGYAAGVDIGTTTVVCCLLDLEGRSIAGIKSFVNPQTVYGDDVISRISYSISDDGALSSLQDILVRKMNEVFGELAAERGIAREDIIEVIIAGNTVMEHLFMGISPRAIAYSPFVPEFLEHPPVRASDAGLSINSEAVVKLAPNVAGYVGGDIVSGVAATNMHASEDIKLLIDIGTNNEIVLGCRDGFLCCAAAAGPALEGAGIRHGMRAGSGAIEKIWFDGDVRCSVIGGGSPIGICGSGIIDAVALLLKLGIITESGKFKKDGKTASSPCVSRIDRGEDGFLRFILTDEDNPVYMTQKDVRAAQLAIGAIKVGIDVLLEKAGLGLDEVAEVLLAGAFGNYINIESAVAVGLLPDVPRNKIRGVRNASGLGACMSAAATDFYDSLSLVAQKMEYVELSSLPDFQNKFLAALSFGRV